MKTALLAALVVALAIALIFVGSRDRTDPETERWKEEAATHQADADYWEEVAKEARERFVADSVRSDSIIKAERRKSRLSEHETDAALETIPEEARRIVGPLIAAERVQHRAEMDTLTAAHDRAMTLIRAELTATQSETESLRAAIHAHEQTVARLEDRLAPDINLFGLVIDVGCTAGVGVTAGYGQAAGVGVTCGVML